MYRIASRSYTTNIDRLTHTTLENLKSDVSQLTSVKETINFTTIQHACSSIYARYNINVNGQNITATTGGSGCFINLDNDYTSGYFLTAAHCVLQDSSGGVTIYTKVDEAYITNPITNEWVTIDVSNNVFLDGAGDIALIKTNIDFTSYPSYCLSLSSTESSTGDACYVCGNPLGIDNDSLSKGVVRDSHYTVTSGSYIADAIHVSVPGLSGNSGSPILNTSGKIIGLFVFGLSTTGMETFNGGPNLTTLKSSLALLKSQQADAKSKKYLGIDWSVPDPFTLKSYYTSSDAFANKGVIINAIDTTDSPFKDLNTNDLLLSVSVNGTMTSFGTLSHQRCPGTLLYSTASSIVIQYIRGTTYYAKTVTLDKTYANVSDSKDLMLIGGGGS
jgi:hypothetical protein